MQIKRMHAIALLLAAAGLIAMLASLYVWLAASSFNATAQGLLAGGAVAVVAAGVVARDAVTQFVASRQARYGAEALLISLALVVALGLANWLLFQDDYRIEHDLTEDQTNTLAPETLDVLSRLEEPVTAVGFFRADQIAAIERAEEVLGRYRAASNDMFDYEFHDPDLELVLAESYQITRAGEIVLEMGDRREPVAFLAEEQLTGALLRLMSQAEVNVYFTTGHQEVDTTDGSEAGLLQAVQALERLNYTVDTVNLLGGDIPEDATVVVIAGPQVTLSDDETAKLQDFLDAGGGVVYLQEPSVLTRIEPGDDDPWGDYLAETWGIALRDDIIIDQFQSIQSATWPLAGDYGFSDITDPVIGLASYYPVARSLEVQPSRGDLALTQLVLSGPTAYGESDPTSLEDPNYVPEPGDDDAVGPLVLAATGENVTTGGRVVVVGDADFMVNGFYIDERVANGDLFINMVKWAATQESLITLSRNSEVVRGLTITPGDTASIVLLSLCVPVFGVILLGGVVWWLRRERVPDAEA